MASPQRLSGADRAWLLMDRPTNPMMVIGLIILARPLTLGRLQTLIRDRFLRFGRFLQLPLADATGATWTQARQFDLSDHLTRVALPPHAGQADLEELVGELASTPFKPGIPRWSFHLVGNYRRGSALIVRVHHCYADGIALLHVLAALADGAAPGAEVEAGAPAPGGLLGGLSDLIEKGVHYALHPGESTALAQGALGFAAELARLGALPDDPPTALKQPLSGIRHAAWAAPLKLEEVRTVGHLLGCTVNDVLVASLAGALGHYLTAHGGDVGGQTLRAAVPMDLRAQGESPLSLGNRFGLVFVDLPIGIRHPLKRLYAVHAKMQDLKGSSQAVATLGMLSLLGSLPAAVEDPAVALFTAKASIVASNLRGPDGPLHLAGVRISELLFWVPQAGSIGTGVSMLSYMGRVQFGVIADREVIAFPRQLVELIGIEFERLVYVVLLGPGSL